MKYIIAKSGGDFSSVAEAQAAMRLNPGSVAVIRGGVWNEPLRLTAEDSGSTWECEDGAVFTGGISASYAETEAPSDEILARLNPDAAKHVRAIDLKKYGASAADWGNVYPIGAYSSEKRYDDGESGENLEVFSGGRRCTLARYPNEGYLNLEAIMDMGECGEFPPQNYWRENGKIRNPRAGTYIMDKQTNERLKNWKTPETAWMFGYFFWDWADSSTPVRVDTVNRALFPKYVSLYGARPGALYYLYNVLEELDAPGEFWLDRVNGMLYVYPFADGDGIEVSLSSEPLISGTADNVMLKGFTLTCTRGNAVTLEGNGNTLDGLIITNVCGHGIMASGSNITVQNCDVSHTGRGGIYVSGGDRITLTPGDNRVINNYIHDFSEVYQTYQAGICISGVGNLCAHNEICGSPHEAITYGTNDIIIEYNYIHDVVLHSSDAGAIYAGFDWCAHGCVIRYNILENIGGGDFNPDGIYWDDGFSGQTAYGNILINVRKNAFLVGGGRDNVVKQNIIIGESMSPISYDDRNRDGFVNGGWAHQAVDTPDAPHWTRLKTVPYNTSEIWKKKYPTLQTITTDFSDPDDPNFPINPANSVVADNIIINKDARLGWLADSVYRYGTVEGNRLYHSFEEANLDPETLKFNGPHDGFPEIPVDEIGRMK